MEDGTYTITGSNEVDIQNDDSYSFDINEDSTSDEKEKEPLFPFMDVTGEVNLYLKGKNVIAMPEDESMKEKSSDVDIDQWEDGNGYSASALKTTSAGKLDAYLRKANNVIEIEGSYRLCGYAKWCDG